MDHPWVIPPPPGFPTGPRRRPRLAEYPPPLKEFGKIQPLYTHASLTLHHPVIKPCFSVIKVTQSPRLPRQLGVGHHPQLPDPKQAGHHALPAILGARSTHRPAVQDEDLGFSLPRMARVHSQHAGKLGAHHHLEQGPPHLSSESLTTGGRSAHFVHPLSVR